MNNQQKNSRKFSRIFLKYFLICEMAVLLIELADALFEGGPLPSALWNQLRWGVYAHTGVLLGALVGSYLYCRKDSRTDI